MTTYRHISHEGDLLIVVDTFDLNGPVYVDASLFQLSLLLKLGKSASLFKFFLTHFPRSFLTLGISKASATLLKHLLLVLVHINGVWPRRLSFRVWVNLTRKTVASITRVIRITPLCDVK